MTEVHEQAAAFADDQFAQAIFLAMREKVLSVTIANRHVWRKVSNNLQKMIDELPTSMYERRHRLADFQLFAETIADAFNDQWNNMTDEASDEQLD